MSFDYIAYRKTKRSGKYKILKRTEKMLEIIRRFKHGEPLSILDVGAADGFMLGRFRDNLDTKLCVGIEPLAEYIKTKSDNNLTIIQAAGENLPFKDSLFDVISAASVLDHMSGPSCFLKECGRLLKDKGIVVISLVSPFFDKMAVKFKIKENDHRNLFSQGRLREVLQEEGLRVLEISRFGLPFFGIFKERYIENILKFFGLEKMMFYIVVVGEVNK